HRKRRPLHRLKRPEPSLRFGDGKGLGGDDLGGRHGPGSAHLDPARQQCDVLGRQFLRRWHAWWIDILERLHQETFVGFAGDNGGAGFSAFEERSARGERKFGLGLLVAVAFLAMPDEERTNLLLEELVGSFRGPSGGHEKKQSEQRTRHMANTGEEG